ncbi:RDD family protein [Cellulomonas sp.]|uniref:RDD family protein n=1 Tax=Cellulomonas sp. TaxID=40001 RepID=UPI003BA86EC8
MREQVALVHAPYPVVDELRPATLARRFAAGVLDVGLLLALGGWLVPAARVRDTAWLALLGASLVLVVAVVQWVLHGRTGATLGRFATGIRTLDVESRRPIGLLRVLLRGAVVAAGLLAFAVGALVVLASPAFDRTGRRRGWHDLAARDEVLDIRSAAPVARDAPRAVHRAEPAPVRPERRPVSVPGWAVAEPSPDGRGTDLLDVLLDEGRPAALVLAPISPQRSGPDLDTRATPVVRQVGLSYGLAPELEMTRPAGPRDDLVARPTDSASVDRTVAEVELGDGRRITIGRTALVGRNPASDADVQLVRVVDPARSVSKTHLQIGVEPGGVWVADRGSTNGTVVTLPDGAQVVCRVDQQVRLRVGSTVSFGDCSLRLVRAPGSDPVA